MRVRDDLMLRTNTFINDTGNVSGRIGCSQADTDNAAS